MDVAARTMTGWWGTARAAADEADFAGFVERQGRLMFRVAMTVARREDEAEEAVQEAFLRMFRGDGWRRAADERAYALRVVWRVAVDAARARGRRREDLDVAEVEIAGRDEGAEAGLARDQERHRLRMLLEGLPEELRRPLLLCSLEEMSSRAVGELLGDSGGNGAHARDAGQGGAAAALGSCGAADGRRTMNEERFAALLEALLEERRRVEPRTGLEGRVLARVGAGRTENRDRHRRTVGLVLASVLALLVAGQWLGREFGAIPVQEPPSEGRTKIASADPRGVSAGSDGGAQISDLGRRQGRTLATLRRGSRPGATPFGEQPMPRLSTFPRGQNAEEGWFGSHVTSPPPLTAAEVAALQRLDSRHRAEIAVAPIAIASLGPGDRVGDEMIRGVVVKEVTGDWQ